MRSATEVRRELELLLRTRCPAVGLVTWEEARTLRLVREVARQLSPGRELFTWSAGQGLRQEGQPVLGLPTPCSLIEALGAVGDYKGPAIFVFLDAGLENADAARCVRDLCSSTGGQPRSLVFIAPGVTLHPTLSRLIPVLEVPTPEKAELKNILNAVASRCSAGG